MSDTNNTEKNFYDLGYEYPKFNPVFRGILMAEKANHGTSSDLGKKTRFDINLMPLEFPLVLSCINVIDTQSDKSSAHAHLPPSHLHFRRKVPSHHLESKEEIRRHIDPIRLRPLNRTILTQSRVGPVLAISQCIQLKIRRNLILQCSSCWNSAVPLHHFQCWSP